MAYLTKNEASAFTGVDYFEKRKIIRLLSPWRSTPTHSVGTELISCRCFPPSLYLSRTGTAEKEIDMGQDRITIYFHVAFVALPVIPLMLARPHQAEFCATLDANTLACIHFADTSLVSTMTCPLFDKGAPFREGERGRER